MCASAILQKDRAEHTCMEYVVAQGKRYPGTRSYLALYRNSAMMSYPHPRLNYVNAPVDTRPQDTHRRRLRKLCDANIVQPDTVCKQQCSYLSARRSTVLIFRSTASRCNYVQPTWCDASRGYGAEPQPPILVS